MALPAAGNSISISQIRDELNPVHGSSYSLRQLSSWAGKGTPDAMSEFYGYTSTTTVDITAYYPLFVGCGTYHTFAAMASTAVSTTLTITMNWYGDLGGFMSGTVYIYSGTTCGSTSVYSSGINCVGEYRQNEYWESSPTSNGSQIYQTGVNLGSSDNPPC
jgi:hypothetical protein